MIEGLDQDDFMDWNYDFFRIHRVLPPIGKANRAAYKLKDLQVTALDNNPSFGKSILASLLVRMYDALWIKIDDPRELIVAPHEKTLGTLARHCNQSATLKHDGTLGG